MNKKLGIGIVVVAIVVASMFAGCIEEGVPEAMPTPTATPTPTSTPKAAPTPTPMVTEQDLQYMEWAKSAVKILMSDIELAVSAANRGDSKALGTYCGMLYDDTVELLNEIDKFDVSPTLQPSKDEFKLALEDFMMTGYYGERGGRNNNDDDINTASSYMLSATRHIDRSTDLLPY